MQSASFPESGDPYRTERVTLISNASNVCKQDFNGCEKLHGFFFKKLRVRLKYVQKPCEPSPLQSRQFGRFFSEKQWF